MKNPLMVIGLACVIALFTGCATPALNSQVVLGSTAEVKAKIKEAMIVGIFKPVLVDETEERLHFRVGTDKSYQVDLYYLFAPAERGTRVSVVEERISRRLNSEGELVSTTTADQYPSYGPGLSEMRGWFFERAR